LGSTQVEWRGEILGNYRPIGGVRVRRLLGFLILIVVLVAVFRGCDQETAVEEKEERAGVEEVAGGTRSAWAKPPRCALEQSQ
jgi:hypothetical protein